jgi:CheY-like chemotaxis protein
MMAQTPPNILIIDDDKDQCNAMSAVLKHFGYEVRIANSGADGLAQYQAKAPDLILLDVAMPGMNGFEVAAEIRRLEGEARRTVIIIVTAFSSSFYVSSSVQNDIDSHLTKPVNPEALVDHVRLMLQQPS